MASKQKVTALNDTARNILFIRLAFQQVNLFFNFLFYAVRSIYQVYFVRKP